MWGALRSRHGQCLYCHPSTLGFRRRRLDRGSIYICGSQQLQLLKIGAIHRQDLVERVNQLRTRRYGGADDWALLIGAESLGAFIFEAIAQSSLSTWQVPVTYFGSSDFKLAREMFRCNVHRVMDVLTTFSLTAERHVSERELDHYRFEEAR
jgi:hypothetical protein